MKRMISLLLVAVLLLTALPFTAWAATTSDGLVYSIRNGTVAITGYTGSAASLNIPGTIEGYPVTTIDDSAFRDCDGLTAVTIPDSVTTIISCAFYDCDGLVSVTIGDGVTNIYSYAFYGCDNLTRVTIPNSVATLGSHVFYGCKRLTQLTIPDSVITIGNNAFSGCSGLTGIVIPDSVTTVGQWAFSDCTGLTEVTISDRMTLIDGYVFYGCSSLTSIMIPDGVTGIGDYAFYNCTGLTSITMPEGVTAIGNSAFLNTGYYMNALNWENDVLYIGTYCIKAKSTFTGSYSIKAGTKIIGDHAFDNCRELAQVTMPDSVTILGNYAFYGCDNLTWVTIPNSVTTIGQWAFSACSDLTTITIPDSVTTIGQRAFYYCPSLTEVTISNSVTTIEDYTFYHCKSLTEVTIPGSVTTIGNNAFSSCSNLTFITIPHSVITIGNSAFSDCQGLTIGGMAGSYAHSYAMDNGFAFMDIAHRVVDEMIAAFPLVITADHRDMVLAAQAAYEALNDIQKGLITRKAELMTALLALKALDEEQRKDKAAAKAVDDMIAALPGVDALTLQNKSFVEAVRAGYQALTATQKGYVTKLKVLEAAEAKIVLLEEQHALENTPAFVMENMIARAGESFTVAVDVKNNPGIVSAKLKVAYDADVLEVLSMEAGVFEGVTFGPVTNTPLVFNWMDSIHPNNTTNGALAYITFKVKDTATAGRIPLTITYNGEDVFDYEHNNIAFETVNGTVDIIECTPGDLNDDGNIDNKDYCLLERYLNGWDVAINTDAANVNRDGEINNKDYSLLQRYLNSWDVTLK
ncbi:MAG: leucine-rich repeat protein [Clostridia bacterium]|nr:leucine-rich repeat protein [Clostridia bacterium]